MSHMKLRHRIISNARTRRELATTHTQLKQARKDYAGGNFSGHPEEQLEGIEHLERTIKRLQTVIASGRVIDYAQLDEANTELNGLYKRARTDGFTDGLRKLITETQERCLALGIGQPAAPSR
ncbi:hypothetical protein [Arthrobacter sp. H14]|uniref:hypothetical protein n=1 Tax=Arthrobacter sp. H14 TaxID=1312959 RepID=UPI00047D2B53|nr:hypothetical protein [Arthrobacter sp. H14]